PPPFFSGNRGAAFLKSFNNWKVCAHCPEAAELTNIPADALLLDFSRSSDDDGPRKSCLRLSRSIIPKKFVPVEIDHSEHEKNAPGRAEEQGHHPEMALFVSARRYSISYHQTIASSTRNTQPSTPKSRPTI